MPAAALALALCVLGNGMASAGAAADVPNTKLPEVPRSQEQTVIVSDHLEMRSTEKKNYFYFKNNVRVEAANLIVESDMLEVVALRKVRMDDPDATIGEIGAIESIVATGEVAIFQAGREAHAGRAEVLPREGMVILSESPRVIDGETIITGWKIILNKGQRQVTVVPNPDAKAEDRQRPTITLGGSALPDLGFDVNDEESETASDEEEESALSESEP